jgi:hypothetical protein
MSDSLSPVSLSISISVTHSSLYFPFQVNTFCNNMAEERELGLIGQSLVTALKTELSEYYRLLSVLETQLRETESGLSLHHLSVWMLEPANRLRERDRER